MEELSPATAAPLVVRDPARRVQVIAAYRKPLLVHTATMGIGALAADGYYSFDKSILSRSEPISFSRAATRFRSAPIRVSNSNTEIPLQISLSAAFKIKSSSRLIAICERSAAVWMTFCSTSSCQSTHGHSSAGMQSRHQVRADF